MSKDAPEGPKWLWRLQEASAGCRKAKMATDAPGSTRRPQEDQNGNGCCSRPQEALGGPKWQWLEPWFWDSSLTMLASPYSAQVLLFVAPLALTMVWARVVRVDSDTCSDTPGESCGLGVFCLECAWPFQGRLQLRCPVCGESWTMNSCRACGSWQNCSKVF